ncbi:MAG: S9 family peptidase [Bacteroidales bacterium]|nr:S9 family peptidase [Bacteroidales bacterium]
MKKTVLLISLLSLIMLYSCKNNGDENQDKKTDKIAKLVYPPTKMVDTVDEYFGVKVPDPYRWLEDDNSVETAEWVKIQNELTFSYLEKIPFRNKIKERLTKIWNYPKKSAPFKEGDKYFYYKNDGLQNQSVLYIAENENDEGKILLDPNKLAEDGTAALSGMDISKDGKLMAYSIASGGSDWREIYVLNIETGELLPDIIKWVKFSGISWYKDGFFYSRYDAPEEGAELSKSNQFHKVYYHKLGTDQAQDELIHQDKKNPKRNFYVYVTEDEKFLIMHESEASHGNVLYFKDLTKNDSKFTAINTGHDYEFGLVGNVDNELFVKTNFNASKYKLIKINTADVRPQAWQTILPETNDVLESCTFAGGKIVAVYMKDAHHVLNVFSYSGNLEKNIELPALGAIDGFNGKKEDKIAYYTFTSFTYPSVVYKYDFETGVSTEFYRSEIEFDGTQYETKQVFYTSKDGTKVPMFLVHKKGIKLDGTNPTLLYGYGGFNVSRTPGFSIGNIVWLENGGVYALANIRGGGEYGKDWHEAGTKLKKQNVFDDFIAAAEYLIQQKYTNPERLAIRGGSNGGLLVGACVNQRPELFKVALPAVGVMDMLRFHKFTIGWAWVGDYGSSENEEEFHYIYKYSPIHNIVENENYPAILVTTADHDDRVVPAHSFKYIAELQAKCKGANPVLIRVDVQAGHGAGKPTSKTIEEVTDIWAFTFFNMGVEPYK